MLSLLSAVRIIALLFFPFSFFLFFRGGAGEGGGRGGGVGGGVMITIALVL